MRGLAARHALAGNGSALGRYEPEYSVVRGSAELPRNWHRRRDGDERGRGTGLPFSQFGAPWLDAPKLASGLAQARLPGVLFEPTRYTPQPLPGIALNPRFAGEKINAVSLRVTSVSGYLPMEVGVHALALLQRQALFRGEPLLPARLNMFHAIAGTRRLHRLLDEGATGDAIVSSWQREVAEFRSMRRDYLVY